MWETWVQSLGREDPLEKETATHSSILAWRIPGQRSLVGYSLVGCKELDTTERLHFHYTPQGQAIRHFLCSISLWRLSSFKVLAIPDDIQMSSVYFKLCLRKQNFYFRSYGYFLWALSSGNCLKGRGWGGTQEIFNITRTQEVWQYKKRQFSQDELQRMTGEQMTKRVGRLFPVREKWVSEDRRAWEHGLKTTGCTSIA